MTMVKRLPTLIIISVFVLSASLAFAKAQDIVKLNTDIAVEKDMVVDNVVAIGGDVVISGRVDKNVVAIGGSVILKPKSYVGEQVVVVGGDIIKDPTAMINGRITQVYMPHFIPSMTTILKSGWFALWATISIFVLLGFLGLAILLIALIPEHMGGCVSALERSFLSMLLWGALWSILIVPIALILAISIIGIILIPLEIMLVVLALILGYIASSVYIGKNVLASFKKASIPFVDAILGILILFLIGFVPVVGPVIKVLFVIAGFGAVLTTRFGTIK
jgi:hypothetical protein